MRRMTAEITKRERERGATVVEFAVIVVLLLIIIFGILELSFLFYQRHFVENAAREGMRVGIRADNFDCFENCPGEIARKDVIEQKVTAYLSALYQPADIYPIEVERLVAEKSLRVKVKVNNFFPQLLSGLVPGFVNPDTITYSTTGRYEDPDEFDSET